MLPSHGCLCVRHGQDAQVVGKDLLALLDAGALATCLGEASRLGCRLLAFAPGVSMSPKGGISERALRVAGVSNPMSNSLIDLFGLRPRASRRR